ncbi:MAG: prepilin peptidase [Gammaproteobacteria bacterium]|nr:MAG: prepilin peptidase [Gammaproteobacteria bacterium]RKZ76619.1 MAG: prepilin peptidase [Gammaproteobacteria bacterium]
MNLFTYLATEPQLLFLFVGILGLIIGSFLNVVIYRLPIMMERQWHQQCAKILNVSVKIPTDPFNLNQPRSHCPHCGHTLKVWENIPIISYIWQRGQCTTCHKSISPRYPLIEIASAILALFTTWHFGIGWPLIGALIFTWALLAASMIDYDHQYLLDDITLPLLWLGLLCNLFGLYTDIESSLIGAMAGYLSLWTVFWLYKIITGKEGMGQGDFKLLALLGAWMGWQVLPVIILLSSLVGTSVGLTLIIMRNHDKDVPIPFGPYLAGAGWINLLWGQQLIETYYLWTYP